MPPRPPTQPFALAGSKTRHPSTPTFFATSRFNPASAGQSIDDAILAIKGDLTAPLAASQLDSWMRLLDGGGAGAQGAMLLELTNLKKHIRLVAASGMKDIWA